MEYITKQQFIRYTNTTYHILSSLIEKGFPIEDNGIPAEKAILWYINYKVDQQAQRIENRYEREKSKEIANITRKLRSEIKKTLEADFDKREKMYQARVERHKQKHGELEEKLLDKRHGNRLELQRIRLEQAKELKDPELDERLLQKRIEKIDVDIRLAETKLLREENILIPIEDVQRVVEDEYTIIRTQLLSIPHRVAQHLLNIDSVEKAYDTVESFIVEVLNDLTNPDELQITPLLEDLEEDVNN